MHLPCFLAFVKIVLTLIVLVIYFAWFCIYYEKAYLKKSNIIGEGRLQFQHPVKHCNPLDKDCHANFRPTSELPYCSQHGKVTEEEMNRIKARNAAQYWNLTEESAKMLSKYRRSMPDFAPFERQKKCQYFDEFDIETYNPGAREKEYMVPTHITKFFQKTIPCNGSETCEEKYEFSREPQENYIGDIESSTILVDHSYLCEQLQMENDAWSLFGMYRSCIECPLMEVPYAKGQKEEWTKEWGRGEQLLEETRRTWGTHREEPIGSGFVSIRYGDYITVKNLLKLAQVDLDLPVGVSGDKQRSRRETGTVIVIEVTYYNYHEYSIPNSLPPVYVYDVFEMPVEKFKTTEMVWKDLYNDERSRTIISVNGVHIALRVKGVLGRFSITATLLMIVEVGVLLGLISWFIQFCVLNWYGGTLGDAFDDALVEEIREETATEHDAKPHVGRFSGFCCSFSTMILGLLQKLEIFNGGRKTLVHIPLVGDAVRISAESLFIVDEKPGWLSYDGDIKHMRSLFVGPYHKLRDVNFPKYGGHSQYGVWNPMKGTISKTMILRYCEDKKEFLCVNREDNIKEISMTLSELGLRMREEYRGLGEHGHANGTLWCCDMDADSDEHLKEDPHEFQFLLEDESKPHSPEDYSTTTETTKGTALTKRLF